MILEHLSASSAKLFEGCPAGWRSRYEGRGLAPGNDAASLGSCIHEVLQYVVEEGLHIPIDERDDPTDTRVMSVRALMKYEVLYWDHLSSDESYELGKTLISNWCKRQDFSGRTVVSTEERRDFPLDTKYGEVPMVFIIDRLDRMDDGEFEVVDYKSGVWQLTGDQLKEDIQALTYATSVWVDAGKPTDIRWRVWVTFDYLRDQPVGIAVRAKQCADHYDYLVGLAERIIESDGTNEKLNPGCRFCVRKHDCSALLRHQSVGGHLGLELSEAVTRRAELEAASKAISTMITELDEVLLAEFKADQEADFFFGNPDDSGKMARVVIGQRRTRSVDTEALMEILPKEALAASARLTLKDVDRLVEEYPEVAAQIRSAVVSGKSKPSIKVIH